MLETNANFRRKYLFLPDLNQAFIRIYFDKPSCNTRKNEKTFECILLIKLFHPKNITFFDSESLLAVFSVDDNLSQLQLQTIMHL